MAAQTRDEFIKQYKGSAELGGQMDEAKIGAIYDSGSAANRASTVAPASAPTDTSSETIGTPPNTGQNNTGGLATPRTIYGDEPAAITAETVDQVQQRMQKDAQARIDSLNQYYNTLRDEQRVVNEKNTRSTNAISTLTGLGGSSDAFTAAKTTDASNQKALAKVEQERNMAIQTILADISTKAVEESRAQRAEARQSEQDRIAYREKAAAEATKNLSALSKATAGLSLEGLAATLTPAEYKHIIDNVGGEAMAKAIIFENRPKDTMVGTPTIVGDFLVQNYSTPDGKVKTESYPLPPEVAAAMKNDPKNIEVVKDDSGLYFLNKATQTFSRITGSGKVSEAGEAGDNPQLYNGLSSKTATAVRAKAAAFKTEPTVQNFAVVQEGRNFAGSLSNTTQNPVDDQSLIYALAKALDPGSVVREGEYATAQKYAQSWAQSYGKAVTQALAGTGFLSEKARANIKDTIEAKYKASLSSYTNIKNQYETGINNLTGRSDGSKFISDYSISSGGDAALKPGETGKTSSGISYTIEQ